MSEFDEIMEACPIVAAVKDMDGLNHCFDSESQIIFVLFGDVLNIANIVELIKSHGKIAMVHIDLINGLNGKEVAVDYIKHYTKADGIISTKHSLIKRAKELGMYTVMRFFVIDSMALFNIKKQTDAIKPDYIEILPGVMPKIIKRILKTTNVKVIAGGLIEDKEDVMASLSAGAISISTTNQKIWFM